jgi:hypothetical protein
MTFCLLPLLKQGKVRGVYAFNQAYRKGIWYTNLHLRDGQKSYLDCAKYFSDIALV